MFSQGKRSTKLSELLQDRQLPEYIPRPDKREVLSPKKIDTNFEKSLSPAKQGKNVLRLELDSMLESAKIRNKPGNPQAQSKLYPNFGLLGKRSVVQFSSIDTENQIELDQPIFLTDSPEKQSYDQGYPRIKQQQKSRYDLARSPAVIGNFAQDTSSQKSCRVRQHYFAEICLESPTNLVNIEEDPTENPCTDQFGLNPDKITPLPFKTFDIEELSNQTKSEVRQSQIAFQSRQDKLREIESRFQEL